MEKYGTVARWNGPFGVSSAANVDKSGAKRILTPQEHRLWVADPKAISHILKNSTTTYRKLENVREMIAFILDRGLAWADGNVFPNPKYILRS